MSTDAVLQPRARRMRVFARALLLVLAAILALAELSWATVIAAMIVIAVVAEFMLGFKRPGGKSSHHGLPHTP